MMLRLANRLSKRTDLDLHMQGLFIFIFLNLSFLIIIKTKAIIF